MSTLKFVDGAYLRADGARDAFAAVSSRLVDEGHTAIGIRSGDREFETRREIFLSRYMREQDAGGRRVYDTRWWNGVLWARIALRLCVRRSPNSQAHRGSIPTSSTSPPTPARRSLTTRATSCSAWTTLPEPVVNVDR